MALARSMFKRSIRTHAKSWRAGDISLIKAPNRERWVRETHRGECKNPGLHEVISGSSALSEGMGAVMEWVVKLEAKSGWGEVETIEVGSSSGG